MNIYSDAKGSREQWPSPAQVRGLWDLWPWWYWYCVNSVKWIAFFDHKRTAEQIEDAVAYYEYKQTIYKGICLKWDIPIGVNPENI